MRSGKLGLSGSGLMFGVPCVLPRTGTVCTMLVCVSAALVCQYFVVLVGRCVPVPVVRDRKRTGAALRCCAWSPRHRSRPRSWGGGSCAQLARGVTWSGRIASRLCATRVRVHTSSREKVLRYACPELRVKVSEWYKCYWVVLFYPFADSLGVGALCIAQFHEIDF